VKVWRTRQRLSILTTVMLGDLFSKTLDRARCGDEHAFSLIYRDVQPTLLRYLRARAPGRGEDICSEAWLEVAYGIGRFRGTSVGFARGSSRLPGTRQPTWLTTSPEDRPCRLTS
jgi:hypothetical protein